ncbi:DinB family protein [bacterium]|nr:DinB family protein [bacterium]
MKTLFHETTVEEIQQRFEKLSDKTTSEWGKMNAAQMLAHCTATMQMPVGDIQIKKSPLSLIGWMFKGLFRNEKPFGKNSPTAPEFIMKDSRDFEVEKQRFLEAFQKLAKGPDAVKCFQHPFFGKMTCDDWGRLMYKHMDHHFRQFGV